MIDMRWTDNTEKEVILSISVLKSWEETNQICQLYGGKMFEPSNQHLENITHNMLKVNFYEYVFWTGIQVIDNVTIFSSDGSIAKFTNWIKNEPEFDKPSCIGKNKLCVYRSGEGWSVWSCEGMFNMLCQISIDNEITMDYIEKEFGNLLRTVTFEDIVKEYRRNKEYERLRSSDRIRSDLFGKIIFITVPIIFIIFILSGILFYRHNLKLKSMRINRIVFHNIANVPEQISVISGTEAQESPVQLPLMSNTKLVTISLGNFSTVSKGIYHDGIKMTDVAIKSLIMFREEKLMQEGSIYSSLDHPNVLPLIGIWDMVNLILLT